MRCTAKTSPRVPKDHQSLLTHIYAQARHFASVIGEYLFDNEISLLIPINVASNPGNFALTLALVFVTEALGVYTLNSNHDFYWEGGSPPDEHQL